MAQVAEYKVYNCGFPGDTTLELLKRFNRDVVSKNPDLVVLLIGSNDMFYPGHILEPAVYRKNLNTLLERIKVINAGCILMTAPGFYIPLLVENFPGTVESPLSIEERLTLLNDTIREVADERDLPLVDLYKLITPADDSAESMVLTPSNSKYRDGMHLTAAGYGIAAGKIFELHQKYFSQCRNIVCLGDSLTYGVYMPGKGGADADALTYPGQLAKLLNN